MGGIEDMFSMCNTDLGSVTFQEFMDEVYKVYNDCDANEANCGKTICLNMDLGSPGDYYRVNEYILHHNNPSLDAFNNYIISVGTVSMGANIYCEKDDADWGDYELDIYYAGGPFNRNGLVGAAPKIATAGGIDICRSYSAIHGEFAIAHGSKVKIRSKYYGNSIWSLTGHVVDLKIRIDGGTYAHDITPAASGDCVFGDDAPCKIGGTDWGYCDAAGKCQYYGFCSSHPGDSRCRTYTVTCGRGTSPGERYTPNCISPPIETCAGNGYSVQAFNLMGENNVNVLRTIVEGEGDTKTFPIKESEEIWVHKSGILNKLWGVYPDDSTAKVSLEFITPITPNGANYNIAIHLGCFP